MARLDRERTTLTSFGLLIASESTNGTHAVAIANSLDKLAVRELIISRGIKGSSP